MLPSGRKKSLALAAVMFRRAVFGEGELHFGRAGEILANSRELVSCAMGGAGEYYERRKYVFAASERRSCAGKCRSSFASRIR